MVDSPQRDEEQAVEQPRRDLLMRAANTRVGRVVTRVGMPLAMAGLLAACAGQQSGPPPTPTPGGDAGSPGAGQVTPPPQGTPTIPELQATVTALEEQKQREALEAQIAELQGESSTPTPEAGAAVTPTPAPAAATAVPSPVPGGQPAAPETTTAPESAGEAMPEAERQQTREDLILTGVAKQLILLNDETDPYRYFRDLRDVEVPLDIKVYSGVPSESEAFAPTIAADQQVRPQYFSVNLDGKLRYFQIHVNYNDQSGEREYVAFSEVTREGKGFGREGGAELYLAFAPASEQVGGQQASVSKDARMEAFSGLYAQGDMPILLGGEFVTSLETSLAQFNNTQGFRPTRVNLVGHGTAQGPVAAAASLQIGRGPQTDRTLNVVVITADGEMPAEEIYRLFPGHDPQRTSSPTDGNFINVSNNTRNPDLSTGRFAGDRFTSFVVTPQTTGEELTRHDPARIERYHSNAYSFAMPAEADLTPDQVAERNGAPGSDPNAVTANQILQLLNNPEAIGGKLWSAGEPVKTKERNLPDIVLDPLCSNPLLDIGGYAVLPGMAELVNQYSVDPRAELGCDADPKQKDFTTISSAQIQGALAARRAESSELQTGAQRTNLHNAQQQAAAARLGGRGNGATFGGYGRG
jgi:hypothetical protein